MKSKKNLHDEMLLDCTISFGRHSDGRQFEKGKPIEPAATDVVVRPTPKLNVAPKPTDPPAPKVSAPSTDHQSPEATGLQRAINANLAKGTRPARTVSSFIELTGLSRAIEANVKLQKSKSNE